MVSTTTAAERAHRSGAPGGRASALGIPTGGNVTGAEMAQLTSLTADSNQVFSLQGLGSAVNLQSFTLVPSNFADPGHFSDLSPLAGLTSLKTLSLQCCGLSDSVFGKT